MHISRLAAIYWYMVTISMRYISRAERAATMRAVMTRLRIR